MSVREEPKPSERVAQVSRIERLQIRGLVRSCVDKKPSSRPDMKEVIQHLNENEEMVIEEFC